jgi:SAM-dependent methyltransferase
VTELKTGYAQIDGAYRAARRDPQRQGWDREDQFEENVHHLERLLASVHFPRKGRLLELGCGAGNIGLYLMRHGFDLTGIDLSPVAVEWARENARSAGLSAEFHVGDVRALGEREERTEREARGAGEASARPEALADGSFDLVLDGHLLHWIIPVGDDRQRVLRAAKRLLKPDGVFCVRSMCNEGGRFPVAEARTFDPRTRCVMNGDVATAYIGDSNDIVVEVITAGFLVLDMTIVPPLRDDDMPELLLLARPRAGEATATVPAR